jgi:hypothetical protein
MNQCSVCGKMNQNENFFWDYGYYCPACWAVKKEEIKKDNFSFQSVKCSECEKPCGIIVHYSVDSNAPLCWGCVCNKKKIRY